MIRASLLATAALAVAFAAGAAHAAEPTPGYRLGDATLPRSPVSLAEFELLKATVLFTDADTAALRRAGTILVPQTEAILDVWYGFVGSNPHLVRFFGDARTGTPDARYLARVRARFARWIKDTTDGNWDQSWLNWQHEIGLRHTSAGKNRTDGVAAVKQVDFRYMVAFISPISLTIRPFLEKGGAPAAEIDRMQAAWTKAVILQTILWSQPYVREGQF